MRPDKKIVQCFDVFVLAAGGSMGERLQLDFAGSYDTRPEAEAMARENSHPRRPAYVLEGVKAGGE